MISNINRLAFTAEKKEIHSSQKQPTSLLKGNAETDKAVLSTNKNKTQETKKSGLPPFKTVALASLGAVATVIAGIMIFESNKAQITGWFKETFGTVEPKLSDASEKASTIVAETLSSEASSGLSEKTTETISNIVNNGEVITPTIIEKGKEIITQVKDKTEEIKNTVTNKTVEVLTTITDGLHDVANTVINGKKQEVVPSVLSEAESKMVETAQNINNATDKTDKVKLVKQTLDTIAPTTEYVQANIHKINEAEKKLAQISTDISQQIKTDAQKATTQLIEETIAPVSNEATQQVKTMTEVAKEKITEVSSQAKQEVKAETPKKALEILHTEKQVQIQNKQVAEQQVKEAEKELKALSDNIDKPLIDIVDEEKIKLTDKQLETACEQLVISGENSTDKAIRAEEAFNRLVTGETKPEEAKKQLEKAVETIKAAGEPEKAKLLEQQYEGKVASLDPKIMEEQKAATKAANEIHAKLAVSNFEIHLENEKNMTKLKAKYEETIKQLEKHGTEEQKTQFIKTNKSKVDTAIAKAEGTAEKIVTEFDKLLNDEKNVKAVKAKYTETLKQLQELGLTTQAEEFKKANEAKVNELKSKIMFGIFG